MDGERVIAWGVADRRHTDWDQIRAFVIESYRVLAPKKLTSQLD